VGGVNQVLKGSLITEVLIQLLPVASPVPVVASIEVVHHWRDPNSIESEVFDVLQLLLNALVISTTVVVQVAT
jgi:hypothetical protein